MPAPFRVGVIGRTTHGNYGHGHDVVWQEAPGCAVVAVADDNKLGLSAELRRL